jgi:hypothetical protein
MAVDFLYAPERRYQEYLGSHNVRENIDVVLSKPIRERIGSLEDIFKQNTDALTDALKNVTWFHDGPNRNVEVVRVNLWAMCDALDARSADSVTGFQALFIKADERDPSFPALEPQAEDGSIYAVAAGLARRQRYGDALTALREAQDRGDTEWRCDQLRGVLLCGLAGSPKSAEVVDLRAAEEAFFTAAARARHQAPSAAAYAMVGAGKAAYAAGRAGDAVQHFYAAVGSDSRCGEAHYQLARLRMQSEDADSVRLHLRKAFECHWSYAIRAASDPVLARQPRLIEKCLSAAARDVVRTAQARLTDTIARFKFLQAQHDKLYPLADDAAFAPLTSDIDRMTPPFRSRLLKHAFDRRKKAGAMHDTAGRMARDYVARLRREENTIIHRDERFQTRRAPADIARRLLRSLHLGTCVAVVVALTAAAGGAFGSLEWPQAVLLLLLLSVIGFTALRLLSGWVAVDGRLEKTITAMVAAWQRFGAWREGRRNRASVARNTKLLRNRLQRIEQRFGIVAAPAATPAAEPPASAVGWARPMVPAE